MFQKMLAMMPVLRSPRFWAIVFVGVVEAVQKGGYLDAGLADVLLSALEMIAGGSALVKTVDRHGEHK